ncbi:CRIB domain-containing protein RIC6 [Hibiscus syriacus]|uniref:CRIB domain-containing protein RIC6 n=1 Tax=Hibiscus syriacus TaxID=106335 RepID=A0A6A2X2I4_HIBSY|nr:CRIB domain-containing protein RIC6 [Hibiscus syriacus]
MSSSNNKMKGLLKGLRYISEIFENEKEPEMQIGLPTDVKHVAHIGWDGPSAVKSAPSWMNEFKSTPANNGEAREEGPMKSVSQDVISRDGSRDQSLPATETTDMPKSSKRGSSSTRNGPTGESTGKEKSDKPKNPKKSSKANSSKETSDSTSKPKKKPKEHKEPKDSIDSDNKKKSSRRKKSKECVEGSSRRSKTRDMDTGSESGSVAGIREEQLSTGSGYEGEF